MNACLYMNILTKYGGCLFYLWILFLLKCMTLTFMSLWIITECDTGSLIRALFLPNIHLFVLVEILKVYSDTI